MTLDKKIYSISNQFIIRRPYYNFKTCIEALNDPKSFDQLISSSDFLEAILISSPDLYFEIKKMIDKKTTAKESSKLRMTLTKFIIRMGFRSTPFGRFASCGIGHFASTTHFAKTSNINNIFQIGYDLEQYLCKTIFFKYHNKFPQLRFVRNQTIYSLSSIINYLGFNKEGFIVAKSCSPTYVIKHIIDIFQKPKTYAEGFSSVSNEFEITETLYAQVIQQLVEECLIIPEFVSEIDISRKSHLENIISLSSLTKDNTVNTIENIIKSTRRLNSIANADERVSQLERIHALCGTLNTSILPQRWLRVDSFLSEENSLNKSLTNTIFECVYVFNRLNIERSSALSTFISKFSSRYEQEKIPLLEVIDPNLGIGYGNQTSGHHPLLNELNAQEINSTSNHIVSINLTPYEQCILKRIRQEYHNCHQIKLSKNDIPSAKPHLVGSNYPSVACMFKYIGKEGNNELISDVEFCGPSASNMISRFAYGNSSIRDICIDICKKEQEQDCDSIYCEISHLANDHVGNIAHRPILRESNCYFMTFPVSEKAENIELSDIYVYCRGRRLFLWSKKHNKNIKLMLTTAFNHHYKTTPLYQFIGDLQNNGINEGFSLTTRNLLKIFDHLPQIRYNNIILSKESWVIRTEDIITKSTNNNIAIKELLRQKNLPRFFSYQEGDNILVFDSDSDLCMGLLSDYLNKHKVLILEEYLPLQANIQSAGTNVEIITTLFKL